MNLQFFFYCEKSISHQHTIFTPHAQRERGKVIGRGVHIYIYMSVVEKIF